MAQHDHRRAFRRGAVRCRVAALRGDRRDYVLLDAAGDVHSLARQIKGARAADIRVRMADLDPATLPGVAEARDARRIAAQPEGAAAGQVVRFPRSSREAAREVTRRRDAAISAGESSGHAGGLYVTVSRSDGLQPPAVPAERERQQSEAVDTRADRRAGAVPGTGAYDDDTRLDDSQAGTCHARTARAGNEGRPVSRERRSRPRGRGATRLARHHCRRGTGPHGGLCEAIAADFAGKIRVARKSLPRDHVAAAVAALKQVKREAVKFVRETAASEIRGRQKRTRLSFR